MNLRLELLGQVKRDRIRICCEKTIHFCFNKVFCHRNQTHFVDISLVMLIIFSSVLSTVKVGIAFSTISLSGSGNGSVFSPGISMTFESMLILFCAKSISVLFFLQNSIPQIAGTERSLKT